MVAVNKRRRPKMPRGSLVYHHVLLRGDLGVLNILIQSRGKNLERGGEGDRSPSPMTIRWTRI